MHWPAAPITVNRTVFGCTLLWGWVLCVRFTNSIIEYYFIMMVTTITGILYPSYSFWILYIGFPNLSSSDFATTPPTWMFLPMDSSFNIRLNTFGLLYVMFRFSTRVFYREFQVLWLIVLWCHWLTTCLQYAGPSFGNLVRDVSGFVSLT